MSPSRKGIALLTLVAAIGAGCDTSALKEAEAEAAYEVSGTVTAVDVAGRSGSVEVVAVDGPLRVRERHVYTSVPPLTSHRVEGGTLHLLDRGCGKQADAAGPCATHYRVEVPRAVAVTVKVGTAPVTVTGVTGALDLTTEVGAINGSDLAGATKATTSVGDVELRYAAPPSTVDVTNDVGATRLFLPAAGRYRFQTQTSASAVVDLPSRPDAPNAVTVRSSTGEVTIGPA